MMNVSRSLHVVVLAAIFFLTLTAVFEISRRAQYRNGNIWEHEFQAGSVDVSIDSSTSLGWFNANRGSRSQLEKTLDRQSRPHTSQFTAEGRQETIGKEEYIHDILKWNRPTKEKSGQWPLYSEFVDKDYDSYRWEGFPQERGYYRKPIHKHIPETQNASERIYHPYPTNHLSQFSACEGPYGKLLNESDEESLRAYDELPWGMPTPFAGSPEAIGLHSGICMEQSQRYRPYGIEETGSVLWDRVRWGDLQEHCVERNHRNFAPKRQERHSLGKDDGNRDFVAEHGKTSSADMERSYSRTAVLIRAWEGYNYSTNDLMNIRAMITELSLQSGGQYQVFLFVNVKDSSEKIHSDPLAYSRVLHRSVPYELQDISILWNEDICEDLYPDVGDWAVHWHQFMPVQWFSQTHPEFDFVWNWEMDVRYIGNYYHLLSQISQFAKRQSRKFLWERNARLYIPSFHGTNYDSYVQDTNRIIAKSAEDEIIARPIWGPKPYSVSQLPLGPQPPVPQEHDDFEWGIGEEADLITLLPIFDPMNTKWEMRHKIWNFVPGIRPQFGTSDSAGNNFNHPIYAKLPRKAYINTTIRLSRRILQAMHLENLAGRSMQAEMWPSTVALHHGFKAVYAPLPIYSDREWPARYADAVFNADGGIRGRWSQEHDSVYNRDREANFRNFSWYFDALFPKVLYRRWMGWKTKDSSSYAVDVAKGEWETVNGNMCLPPMLLHPIKRKDLQPT